MKKKTLLITGASRGIGAAIARRAATEFSVVINYQNSVDAANNLVKENLLLRLNILPKCILSP